MTPKQSQALHDIRHALWHALDDGEEVDGGRIIIDAKHYAQLSALINEDHPQADSTAQAERERRMKGTT